MEEYYVEHQFCPQCGIKLKYDIKTREAQSFIYCRRCGWDGTIRDLVKKNPET